MIQPMDPIIPPTSPQASDSMIGDVGVISFLPLLSDTSVVKEPGGIEPPTSTDSGSGVLDPWIFRVGEVAVTAPGPAIISVPQHASVNAGHVPCCVNQVKARNWVVL